MHRFPVLLCLAAVLLLPAAASGAPPGDGGGVFFTPSVGDAFFDVEGRPLGDAEALAIDGGDVRMDLDDMRTSLSVWVGDNRSPTSDGGMATVERYTIPVHNRIVDTNGAPFIPGDSFLRGLQPIPFITSKPIPFPAGTWNITGVATRIDNYGPYMIRTDAIGKVNVFKDGAPMGVFKDSGYGIHSNIIPFEQSRSHGCLVVSQKDSARLVATLKADRERNPKSEQTILIPPLPAKRR